jgi:hypothetical protein
LRDIEYGIALEKRDAVLSFVLAPRILRIAVFSGCEAVGVGDRGAVFAFADVAAEGQRLFEGQTPVGVLAAREQRVPHQKDIDARIDVVRGGIDRHGQNWSARSGLNPGDRSGHDLFDDPVGDLLIMPRPQC